MVMASTFRAAHPEGEFKQDDPASYVEAFETVADFFSKHAEAD